MNAVIYCRVSSKEQVGGTSLESQELACKEYAACNDLKVARTFIERGESAKFADRPQLLELLAFCAKREHSIQQVLVWKVDRLARNVGDHFNIKAGLMKQGIRVISVTEPIDTKPEGKLLETILAGFAQFDNDIRAARCTQGMRRKIQEGLFPWKPPIGYKSANQPRAKKTLPDVPDEPAFGIIKWGLEEFAAGNVTKAELIRMLTTRGLRTRRGKLLPPQSVDHLLADEFYAGVIRDPWTDEEFQGKHVPMISRRTFSTIQRVIAGRNRSVPHISARGEFPLRTFARCASCEAMLTGSFSRGRSARYPYYRCFRRDCDNGISYPQAEVHGEFTSFLDTSSLDSHTFAHLKDTVAKIGAEWERSRHLTAQNRDAELKQFKGQLDRLLQLKMDNLITDEEFRTQRSRLRDRIAELDSTTGNVEIRIEPVLSDLEKLHPSLIDLSGYWSSLPIESRKRFQFLMLPTGYVVGRIGTARRGRLFSLIGANLTTNASLVHPAGDFWNQLVNEIMELAMIFKESTIP